MIKMAGVSIRVSQKTSLLSLFKDENAYYNNENRSCHSF